MEIVKAIVLGLVQGLSEFLPISSSGHLVLAGEILNFHQEGIAFEVFVHFGTLVAVLFAFRQDISQMFRTLPGLPAFLKNGLKPRNSDEEYVALSFYIILGSIPAAVIGLLFEKPIEALFQSVPLVLAALMVTALVMWSSRYTREKRPFMNGTHSVLIGIAQAFAIIPGISRSGSTIVTGMWLGIRRDLVARFSFLLSVPVIFGATLLKFKSLLEVPPPASESLNLVAGTVAAAVSGYFAIIWLLNLVRKQKLEWFGVYCAAVSVLGFLVLLMR